MSLTKRNRRFVRATRSRQLRLEPLEDRRLLAAITVNSSADDLVDDGMVTLREAIQAANTDASVDGSTAGNGADTIEFDGALSGQTITLGGTNLEITEALTIDATALVQNVTVTVNANTTSRIFNITATTGDFTLAGLTLTGGMTTGNNANASDTTFSGAAVRSLTTGSLTIDQSTISDNSTTGIYASGGGIRSIGDITLTSSTVSDNSTAGQTAKAGGIFSSGAVTLTNSTVSGNSTSGLLSFAGGIYSFGALTLTNSTVSGNSTTGSFGYAGGISTAGAVTLVSSTVTDNHAYDPTAMIGGIWNNNDPITFTNSIVAGNTAGGGINDINPGTGTFSVNYSLIGSGVAPDADTSGNNVVTNNPLIGPLANNGGPTETHALLAGSLAIDAGDPSIVFNLTEFDQRGAPYVRVYDDLVALGSGIDIGAFELQPPFPAQGLIVDTVSDIFDGDFTIGNLALREAVFWANLNPLANTITFDASLSGQTITLGGTDLEITAAVTIDATSLAQNVTIDANLLSRIFNITATTGNFTLAGLILTGGKTTGATSSGFGGAIRSLTTGNLTIDQSTVSGNSTVGYSAYGGGIFSTGSVTLTSSTVSGNFTTDNIAFGGGIFSTGSVTLTSSTVSGNSTAGNFAYGGGIRSTGSVTLTSSTVSGNSTTGGYARGGGIHSTGSVTLTSSTVSGNSTAGNFAKGGGIHSSGNATLTQSTVSGNSTTGYGAHGGGIYSTSSVTLTSSTVSGNSTADANGGGIYSKGGVTLTSSTVTDNHAYDPTATGGGIWNNDDTIVITNSIVAGNTAGGGSPDIDPGTGVFDVNFSLLGTAVTPDAGGSGNLFNDTPLIGPLTGNGGPTETHALLPGSLAIDAGDSSFTPPPDFDQRGTPFDRDVDIKGGGVRIDIGAYEVQAAPASLVVDTTVDEIDTDFGPGDLSLREAIGWADTFPGANTITFDASLSGQTITLGGTDLEITAAVTIDATSLAQNVTIDANLLSRIFNITATTGNFTLAGLILTGGKTTGATSSGFGGAIRSLTTGNLTIDQSTVSGNSTVGYSAYGGGIFSTGSVTLTSSTVSGNFTTDNIAFGGGIFSTGSVTLTSSTVSGNSTAGNFAYGGGIRSTGSVTLTSSTVSGNSTTGGYARGGGIHSTGSVTLTSSTVSGNSTAGNFAKGGGIHSSGNATLTQSTVSGNSTTGYGAHGGGIYSTSSVTLTSSTVSGNSTADANGGGIYSKGGVTLTSSTVTDNHAYDPTATGGGIWNNDDTIVITNSIVAGNTAGGGMDDINPGTGLLTVDFSLIGDNDGTGLTEAPIGTPDINGNLIGGPINGVIDPLLDPLADNGGPTETHALLAGSPAIDAGDPTAMAGVGGVSMFDQRGMPFGRVEDGDGNMTARIDMGAYEVQSTTVPTCDFDGMNGCNIDDIDAMVMEIVAGTNSPLYDLTNDGLVNLADRDQWLADAGALNLTSGNPYLLGDSNLDGVVDGQDFLVWNANKFMSTGKWSQADWNADGITDGQDFIIWNGNKFQSSDGLLRSVLPSASHPSYEIAPTVELQTREQSTTRLLGLSQIIPSTNTKRIDAVFAGFHQREERADEQRQADIFDALIEDFPLSIGA